MNFPKSLSLYCPTCKKHTVHKMKLFKPGQARSMAKGTRRMQRKHKSGYGGKTKFPAYIKKQNKRPTFIAECETCKKKINFVINKRMKKAELV